MLEKLPWRCHPVLAFPKYKHDVVIFDHTLVGLVDGSPKCDQATYGIGRYNEKRPNMYTTDLFSGRRNIHMGLDFTAPDGTPVYAFKDCRLHLFGYNPAPGDYGYVLTIQTEWEGRLLFALYGHLSHVSIAQKYIGQTLRAGEKIGELGHPYENGGWPPHLHFQLSWQPPPTHDMPGVVAPEDLHTALTRYPDPRMVLGPLY